MYNIDGVVYRVLISSTDRIVLVSDEGKFLHLKPEQFNKLKKES